MESVLTLLLRRVLTGRADEDDEPVVFDLEVREDELRFVPCGVLERSA